MSFLDFLQSGKESKIKIVDDLYLRGGECINLYGDQYVGKTSFCFYVVKNNPKKKVIYVDTEILTPLYRDKLNSLSDNVYILKCSNIKSLKTLLKDLNADLIIVDSITAMNYIENKKEISDLFDFVEENKLNLILISQIREFNDKQYYEHKKLLDFFSYRIKTEKYEDSISLDNKYKINFNEIW